LRGKGLGFAYGALFMISRKRKFISYYKPYLRLFYADLGCAFLLSATTLAFPLCTRFLTKDLQNGITAQSLNSISGMAGIMFALLVVHVACRWFIDYQGHVMGALMEADMRRELFEHYQKLSLRFYDEQRTGELMTRITNDTTNISELFHHGPEDLVISSLNFIGAFTIMMCINFELACLIFLFFPMMAYLTYYFVRKMNVSLRSCRDRIGDINAYVEDALSGIRVVKSFTNEEVERRKFVNHNQKFVVSRREAYRSEAFFWGGMNLFIQLMPMVLVIFGGVRIVHGELDFADLLTFLLFAGILTEPLMKFINLNQLYQEAVTGFDRCMEVLEIEPDVIDKVSALEMQHVEGDIVFNKVSFGYSTGTEPVLNNIDLSIKAGEFVAIVGGSGTGKSTLCALIPRFYDVTKGSVCIDGVDVREISQASLRRHIGIVHQDVFLFAGSVAENITYGKPGASREEIIASAKKAYAHEFIMALPAGYDTDIGQRGVKLSGGQKQRLSIARAFLKDPSILIFDEATSALDMDSERAVQESMEELFKNRTTIVIAHRLSTVKNAQRIIVLSSDDNKSQTYLKSMSVEDFFANSPQRIA
jgi:ATP-binding cassette subfamily B protein